MRCRRHGVGLAPDFTADFAKNKRLLRIYHSPFTPTSGPCNTRSRSRAYAHAHRLPARQESSGGDQHRLPAAHLEPAKDVSRIAERHAPVSPVPCARAEASRRTSPSGHQVRAGLSGARRARHTREDVSRLHRRAAAPRPVPLTLFGENAQVSLREATLAAGSGVLCRVDAHSTSPRQLNAAPSAHTAPQPATV